jgi:maltodextrin utilization protein YvdJ
MNCRIGNNCNACEWKRIFGYDCSNAKEVDNEIAKTKKTELKFVPAESTSPFYVKRRKKGRIVKEEKKYTEIKSPKINVKEENRLIEKIGIAVQDHWISKIKTL